MRRILSLVIIGVLCFSMVRFDNVALAQSIARVILVGDINDDGRVDMKDVGYVAKSLWCVQGDPLWDSAADVYADGRIDMKDISLVARHFGDASTEEFYNEVTRLRQVLHQDYLQRDPNTTSLCGVKIPSESTYELNSSQLDAEVQDMQKHGVIFTRWWYQSGHTEEILQVMSKYGIKTMIVMPSMINDLIKVPWHSDPFDYQTVEQLWNDPYPYLLPIDVNSSWSKILDNYGNDPRVHSFDLFNEPLINTSKRQSQLQELTELVGSKTTKPFGISLDHCGSMTVEQIITPLAPYVTAIFWHEYDLSLLRLSTPAKPWVRFDQELTVMESFGKPIYITEFGFPTWSTRPTGNSPYNINIATTTVETEQLQYDWLANMLHTIKMHNVAGYIIHVWWDYECLDSRSGSAGFGLKSSLPELNEKLAINLIP